MSAQIQIQSIVNFVSIIVEHTLDFQWTSIKRQKKHQPIEAKTGKIHECPKRGWSESVSCYGCEKQVIFLNSQKSELTGKNFRLILLELGIIVKTSMEENTDV